VITRLIVPTLTVIPMSCLQRGSRWRWIHRASAIEWVSTLLLYLWIHEVDKLRPLQQDLAGDRTITKSHISDDKRNYS